VIFSRGPDSKFTTKIQSLPALNCYLLFLNPIYIQLLYL